MAFSTLAPVRPGGPPAHKGYRMFVHNERQQVRGGQRCISPLRKKP
jgi:hypothetical protein